MLIRELVTHLGFDVDFAPLNKFDAKIEDTKESLGNMESAADDAAESVKRALVGIRNTLIGLSAATAVGATGLIAMVKSAANVGDEINKTAPLLGFSVEEFQKYQYAAKLAGVENENFAGSIQLLLRNIAEAKQGNKETIKSFARAGIDPKSLAGLGTGEILRRLSDGLSKIPDQATKVSVSMDLLGRSGARMGMFLAKGTDEMDALMGDVEAFGMFTEETAQQSEDLNDSLDRVLFFFRGIKNEIGQGLLPVFTQILNEFREWLSQHREIIKAGLAKGIEFLTHVITRAWDATKRVVHGFETMIRLMGGYRNTLRLFGMALLGMFIPLIGPIFLATRALGFLIIPFIRLHTLITLVTVALSALMPIWSLFVGVASALVANQVIGWLIRLAGGYRALASAMLLPIAEFMAMAAAIAACILIGEDLGVWLMGGKSVIGQWLGPWGEVPAKIRKIWGEIKEVFKEGGAFIMAVLNGDFKEAARLFAEMSAPVVNAGVGVGNAVVNRYKAGNVTIANPLSRESAGSWGGMAPAYVYAATPDYSHERNVPALRSLDEIDPSNNYHDNPGVKAGGARGATVQQHNKIDISAILKEGTTANQANEIVKIVRDTLNQQIDHSLQQSIPPGG